MKTRVIGILFLTAFMYSGLALAKSAYLKAFKEAYPNATALHKCNVCHEKAPKLNPYGLDYGNHGHDFKEIEPFDSDGDTVSNLDEINQGTWPGEKNQ